MDLGEPLNIVEKIDSSTQLARERRYGTRTPETQIIESLQNPVGNVINPVADVIDSAATGEGTKKA